MRILYALIIFCFCFGCKETKNKQPRKRIQGDRETINKSNEASFEVSDSTENGEGQVVLMRYNISLEDMRRLLGKKDEQDPFFSPERAGPIELLERAGIRLDGVYVDIFPSNTLTVEGPYRTQKAIQVLIGKKPTKN